MQIFIVYTIIFLCAAYALWRIYTAVHRTDDPCSGCEGCALKEIKQKKDCEKFGRKK